LRTLPDIEPADEIVPRILTQYSKSPRGWRVLSTPRGEMLVVGPDSAFQLKLISLNPMEFTGAGIELTDSNAAIDRLRTSPEYGLRPLDTIDIQNLLESMTDPVSSRTHLESIIQRDPILPRELEKVSADHLLTGPVFTRPDLGSMSPEILKIQDSLERSAQSIFKKRYPMRAGMYF
ncbi:MAG: hypothetical protein JW779_12100, partial [Candidatus Thorarchaeota archaeon]|nr:hypothetical protein [Candidatus Thorarchaeota archaeon]